VAACTKKVAVKTPPAAQPEVSRPAVAEAPPARVEPTRVAEAKPAPKSEYPDAKTLQRIDELLSRIQDAYFDYDKHNLRPDAVDALQADARTLATIVRQYPAFKLLVEGHADERGSGEYNLALGDARATKTKEYQVQLGLPAEQMNVVSFGKEKPVCTEHDESCWQKNRRAHLTTADARVHQ
jgi:peptidoglycan-associated lipoprotein